MSQPPPPDQRTIAYRPALDGVRAIAVTAVLLFHGGVAWLPGGFLGVDAFFVLSGFLITALLVAEHAHHGRVDLAAFWLRRARRLLPALMLVLLVTVVAYRGVLAPVELALLRGDALAALGYVANWRMIYRGDDYFTQTAAPSPLQHTWSLGIEEQFYLVWPIVVTLLLAHVLTRSRGALLGLCLVGGGASAALAAGLADPFDIGRAYFGTDTRAQSLLVGAALAVLLAPGRGEPLRLAAWVRPAAYAAGTLGIAATAWLWAHADGERSWLYRGGLTLSALAVAAVLAHVTVSPDAIVARALACAPLVLLGRISYGVYLWHWPIFGLLTGERTGLSGPPLLLLRVGVTVAAAAASFVMVEQPIRTGHWSPRWRRLRVRLRVRWRPTAPVRWPLRAPMRTPERSPFRARPRAIAAGFAVMAVATGGVVVAATMPPRQSTLASGLTLPASDVAVTASPGPSGAGAHPPPIQRAGRRPGALPRITFFGDSVSWTLGTYLPEYSSLAVTVRAVQGCGIARLPEIIQHDDPFTNYPGCTTWDARWRRGTTADDPDVAVILLDRWELMDRKLNGTYQHVGQPEYDDYLTSELELAISVVAARGAHVALLTAPYTRRVERPDGGLFPEDEPQRVDAWNELIRAVAARHPRQVSVIDLNRRVCPDGRFTWSIGDLRIRSDGLHFTPEGVRRWIAPWLMPQLLMKAVTAHDALKPGD